MRLEGRYAICPIAYYDGWTPGYATSTLAVAVSAPKEHDFLLWQELIRLLASTVVFGISRPCRVCP